MFYMVPQYIVITVGEIMFSISGLGFAYAQVIYENNYFKKNKQKLKRRVTDYIDHLN